MSSSRVQSTSTSGAASSSVTAFVNRANAICTEPQTGPSPGPFPFPSFDPLHPARSKLPAIGHYFERVSALPLMRRQLAQLKALGTPPKDQPDWTQMLAAMKLGLTATARQYQAALATDVPVFIATVHALTTAFSQERAAAAAFGAQGCGPGPKKPSGRPPGAPPVPPQARLALGRLAACMRAGGVAVHANLSGNGPPLTTRVPTTGHRYQAEGAKCRAQLASRFPILAQGPMPP